MSIAFVDEDKWADLETRLPKSSLTMRSVRLVQTQAEGQPHDRDSAIQSLAAAT